MIFRIVEKISGFIYFFLFEIFGLEIVVFFLFFFFLIIMPMCKNARALKKVKTKSRASILCVYIYIDRLMLFNLINLLLLLLLLLLLFLSQ